MLSRFLILALASFLLSSCGLPGQLTRTVAGVAKVPLGIASSTAKAVGGAVAR